MIHILENLKFIRNTPFVHQGRAGEHLMISGNPCFELEEAISGFFSAAVSVLTILLRLTKSCVKSINKVLKIFLLLF